MQKKTKYDLTSGAILPRLITMSMPIMATAFMQMAYNLTDMFWLGRLSASAVAASGTSGMYMWLSMAFIFMFRLGAEIGVSQNMGKGNPDEAQRYAQNSMIVALLMGILYGAAMVLFRGPLIAFFDMYDTYVIAMAEDYLLFVAVAMPFVFVHQVVTGMFNGYGNTKMPFYINSLCLLVNIVISPFFIFDELVLFNTVIIQNGLGLGIIGAAVSTSVANMLNFALKLCALMLYKGRPFQKYKIFAKLSMVHIKQMLKWGAPLALESMFFTLLFMVVARLVAEHGTAAIAASRVGSQVESLSWMISGGFATAFTAFAGQNFGAKKWARLHSGFKLSLMAMTVYGIFVTFILFFFAEPLISIFLFEPNEIEIGVMYLRIFSLTQSVNCMEAVAAGAFRGRGLTGRPAIVTTGSNILRVIFAYALGATALGLRGIWIGAAISAGLRSVALLCWYYIDAKKLPKEDEELLTPVEELTPVEA